VAKLDKLKQVDRKFFRYNVRNILTNLLQAEEHARDMQTMNFVTGEGSCYLKHLLFVRGEVEEAMNDCASLGLKKEGKIFEKIKREMDEFFEKVETNNHNYHKADLINIVRKWRKEVESTAPWYQTFYCKCLHSIPYIKTLLYFLIGMTFAFLLKLLGV